MAYGKCVDGTLIYSEGTESSERECSEHGGIGSIFESGRMIPKENQNLGTDQ